MVKRILGNSLFLIFLILSTSGCLKRVVEREDPATVIDLSGRWNDSDSSEVSNALINQMLDHDWYSEFRSESSRNPSVICGRLKNNTLEHISSETITKDLERAMINSGRIDVIASRDEREEIRTERNEMIHWASVSTRKKLKNETAADFMLKGVMNSIIDEYKGKIVVYYQTDLNLIDTESNTVIWAGQKKIKKTIKKPLFRF
ncbi:penicillin-binding protein activator LpoB [Elusimicrobiota bacterium]